MQRGLGSARLIRDRTIPSLEKHRVSASGSARGPPPKGLEVCRQFDAVVAGLVGHAEIEYARIHSRCNPCILLGKGVLCKGGDPETIAGERADVG